MKKIDKRFILIYCIILAVLMSYLSLMFMQGFHDIDIGMNMRALNEKFNIGLIDIGLDGVERTPAEAYNLGVTKIFYSFIAIMPVSICFGIALMKLYINGE